MNYLDLFDIAFHEYRFVDREINLILAICRLPQFKDLEINTEALFPITLVCDNIRDPGNMGTILRAAAAAGCHSVLATTGKSNPVWYVFLVTSYYF